ncbi:uncharacterized protein L201_000917 [Kwoniella dendrophila CBS 6074]|uniref:C2H2-type domain-containing protein n=1 Tax=Kwoniella dendrophila CBS 6074 TaxID=1295534 RepID=A0AAX4JM26_9TREE
MQQYMPSTTPMGSPHFAHNDPWAHALICCDQDHGASSSMNQLDSHYNHGRVQLQAHSNQYNHSHSTQNQNQAQEIYDHTPPNNGFSTATSTPVSLGQPTNQSQHQPGRCIECSAECPLEAYCCGGDYCCDGSHSCDKSEDCSTCEKPNVEPCQEEHAFHPTHKCDDPTHDHGMKSLEEWADTKEGCHAIQQLLECCNQPDCNIPACPTDSEVVHPPPPDPLAALFGSLSAQPVEPVMTAGPGPDTSIEGMTHTCHWGNCHLIFKSMPDLLAHVAADHLSAWGIGSGPKSTDPAQPMPTVPPPQMPISSNHTSNFMSTPPLNLTNTGTMPVNSAFPTPQATETDQLLSCLWDDCFPIADLPTSIGESFPQNNSALSHIQHIPHTHSHQAHGPAHEHTTANGEPFSPGTMLRHVLEEHLGVPGSIIGWPNDPSQQGTQQAYDKNHHHHHIDPHHLAHHHDHPHNHNHNHLHQNHVHGHTHNHNHNHQSHPFPTPPSTVNTQLSTSPASVPSNSYSVANNNGNSNSINTNSNNNTKLSGNASGNPLICLWPGCPLDHVFPDSASLMDHLSEVHIPKGKDSYTCHWDNCGDGQGRTFKSRQKVLRHLQSHTGHKPFVCGVCDQAFSEAAPLSAHMRRHAQQKPFKCEYPGCGKTFAVSSSLTIHMRTHNGEKPYICPHCGRGFVEASNLTKHVSHTTDTGERPFSCAHPGCGKKFSRPDQLKRHMLVHDKPAGPSGHARRRSSAQTEKTNNSNTSSTSTDTKTSM